MKWAKLKSDRDFKKMNAADKKQFFEAFDSIDELPARDATYGRIREGKLNGQKKALGAQFNPWIYDKKNGKVNDYFKYPSDYTRVQMRNYEMFCGGWLRFYEDVVLEDKAINHTLFFQWDRKQHRVTIWISPVCIDREPDVKQNGNFITYRKYNPAVTIDPPTVPPPPPPPRTS